MQILLAWAVYLILGVGCLALGWGWLGPRLPGRVRVVVLGLLAGLAVVAMAVAARVPHDYRATDVVEYGRGVAALVTELLVAIAGGTAALAAIGRRRTQNAALCAVGLYLAGTGLALDGVMGGQATLQAPILLVMGAGVALAGAGRLAGLPRRRARELGLAAALVMALLVGPLRGMGSRGGGPGAASTGALVLVGAEAGVLLLGGAFLVRAHGRVLAGPLARALVGVAGTGLVLLLRGPGEWAPGPGASSTSLYGLPLTLLVVAVSLGILESPVKRGRPAGRQVAADGGARLAGGTVPGRPAAVGLMLLFGLMIVWRPAPEPCMEARYAESSLLGPDGPAWAESPGQAAPRRAPDAGAFEQVCTHRPPDPSQLLNAYFAPCKWAQVDANYPLVQAGGTLRDIVVSSGDSPWLHASHDLGLNLAVDPASAWLVLGSGAGEAILHAEVESGRFPAAHRPVAGDRVTVAGRWIFDCGHTPKTEIHPAAIVAGEHEEWRTDAAGGPQQARVLRVWMNSAPGVVRVPLAPFALRVQFPSRPSGQGVTPMVQVVSGAPGAVQWTIEGGAGAKPEAAVRIAPPAADETAYFELLLGYKGAAPAPNPPAAYTVTFDRLVVSNDLRRAARNAPITGLADVLNRQLGLASLGHWFMHAIVDHAWRDLLADAPVESGHVYSLAEVSPVPIWAAGDGHLHLAITGYANNDPLDGVELASGRVGGAASLKWDAGRLAHLCCGTPQTFSPSHGAWTLAYHVSRGNR